MKGYGVEGQKRSGTPRSSSANTRRSSGTTPVQSQRGFGPSRNPSKANHGTPSKQRQNVRSFRDTKTNTPSAKVTSAGRIRRIGGKGR